MVELVDDGGQCAEQAYAINVSFIVVDVLDSWNDGRKYWSTWFAAIELANVDVDSNHT